MGPLGIVKHIGKVRDTGLNHIRTEIILFIIMLLSKIYVEIILIMPIQ